ncbi:MAG: NAD-dependent epimerase/dehydratase family protein [Geodermatophilaceae bacterium]|nr:NAD-dependent epimerase/dehydratase family protein [Geodermatophilaceae bacterium]
MPPKVVLVTGVSRYLGGQLAAVLAADPAIDRVIGLDSVPPSREMLAALGRTEFVRADIRNPLIAKVISSAEVDTVVHMNIGTAPGGAGGRASMKELNVLGTMQLLAACQKAETLRRLVVKSTTTVYGSSSRDPALFTEDMDARAVPSSGYAKDSVEIEGYVRGFARRRPDVSLAVLRFTNFIGRHIDSMLTRYFSMPLVPTVLGFDARVQMLHEQDALEVLRLATVENYTGTVNVGGEGVLLLSQAIRRAGRIPVSVPVPLVGPLGGLLRQTGVADFSPEQLRFLNFGRVVDISRLIDDFGYRPRLNTAEAFADFCAGHRPVIDPARIRALERRLLRVATLNRIQEPVDA